MPHKITQADRLAVEHQQRPRPAPSVVDLRYHLQPDDLPATSQQVVVRAVTTQGLEVATALLHFEGLAKPLGLDAVNGQTMMALTTSPMFSDWVGHTVELRVVTEKEIRYIRVIPPRVALPVLPETEPQTVKAPYRPNGAVLLLLLIVLLLVGVYLIENWGRLAP